MNQNLPTDTDGKLYKWAWPGGYPLFYLDGENSVLCPDCANASVEAEEHFQPQACDANWDDPMLYCEQCGERIESAYAEDEAWQTDRARQPRA